MFATEYCAGCSKHCGWPTSAVLGPSLGEWARYGYSRNFLVKTCYVEKMVSKVIIIACDYLLVSKMPKKRRENEENRLFPPKPGFRQSWTNVLGIVLQYYYFSVISRFPFKTVHPFRNVLAVLPFPTLFKVETRKKFSIQRSNIVCVVRGGFVWIGKRPRNKQKKKDDDFCKINYRPVTVLTVLPTWTLYT